MNMQGKGQCRTPQVMNMQGKGQCRTPQLMHSQGKGPLLLARAGTSGWLPAVPAEVGRGCHRGALLCLLTCRCSCFHWRRSTMCLQYQPTNGRNCKSAGGGLSQRRQGNWAGRRFESSQTGKGLMQASISDGRQQNKQQYRKQQKRRWCVDSSQARRASACMYSGQAVSRAAALA